MFTKAELDVLEGILDDIVHENDWATYYTKDQREAIISALETIKEEQCRR